jgi:hypothetical protein
VDSDNYWTVVAAPNYTTWVVTEVSEGVRTTLGNLGTYSLNQVESSIKISMLKDKIKVSAFGGTVFEFSDKNYPNLSRVGLIGIGQNATGTRWEYVTVTPK